eukprot:TRINITY_DN6237_c0_g1_i1.p1 TRINITY_DN6237_c0_g1~~TRINITY_DN6237_c0_g1_i1.p1  ORF type:complete len:264 (-),score=20.75 TRINITY_DN6237_c0_g1_i1:666-1457(-)
MRALVRQLSATAGLLVIRLHLACCASPRIIREKVTAIASDGDRWRYCIRLSDWTKRDIHTLMYLAEYDEHGCCPEGYVPGAQYQNTYAGPQILCGFEADGSSREMRSWVSPENGTRHCDYGLCFFVHMDGKCRDGSLVQRLNGCCSVSCRSGDCNFPDNCKNFAYTFNNQHRESAAYCLTYNEDFRSGTLPNYRGDETHKNLIYADPGDGDTGGTWRMQTSDLYSVTWCPGHGVPVPTPSHAASVTAAWSCLGAAMAALSLMF